MRDLSVFEVLGDNERDLLDCPSPSVDNQASVIFGKFSESKEGRTPISF